MRISTVSYRQYVDSIGPDGYGVSRDCRRERAGRTEQYPSFVSSSTFLASLLSGRYADVVAAPAKPSVIRSWDSSMFDKGGADRDVGVDDVCVAGVAGMKRLGVAIGTCCEGQRKC